VLKRWRLVGETEDLPTIISRAGALAEDFTAEIDEDGQVVNAAPLRDAWQTVTPLFGVLGLPSSTSEADVAQWRTLAGRVGEVIGLDNVSDERVPALTGECGAVLVVAAEPRIG
jgi:hypothetical protein